MTTYIHPTALVEAGARVGAGTRIWHHAHVREGATIGEGCALGKNVFVDAGVTVGYRVKVQSNVSVYAGVELADDVFVGPSTVFTNDRVPRAAETGLSRRRRSVEALPSEPTQRSWRGWRSGTGPWWAPELWSSDR